jgi:peroxiredoxin
MLTPKKEKGEMARIGSRLLDKGDPFPNLSLKTIDGSDLQTKDWMRDKWKVILFYRGFWCPFCKTQLKSFQSGLEKLTAEGIDVLAISVDPLDKAKETQKETGATFPIAFGVPVKETSEAIGAFYDDAPVHTAPYIHSTGFVLGPDGKVVVSVYSSSAIGRLVWQDILVLVQYMKSTKK